MASDMDYCRLFYDGRNFIFQVSVMKISPNEKTHPPVKFRSAVCPFKADPIHQEWLWPHGKGCIQYPAQYACPSRSTWHLFWTTWSPRYVGRTWIAHADILCMTMPHPVTTGLCCVLSLHCWRCNTVSPLCTFVFTGRPKTP